jgi:hypothetical protein
LNALRRQWRCQQRQYEAGSKRIPQNFCSARKLCCAPQMGACAGSCADELVQRAVRITSGEEVKSLRSTGATN